MQRINDSNHIINGACMFKNRERGKGCVSSGGGGGGSQEVSVQIKKESK